MKTSSQVLAATAIIALLTIPLSLPALEFEVIFSREIESAALDGRVLLLLSTDPTTEPRFQSRPGVGAIQIFGRDVDGFAPGEPLRFDHAAPGYPIEKLGDLPPGSYSVQALLHRYETFNRADGHTVKLPMDRGEGQQWSPRPGNLYSTPQTLTIDPSRAAVVEIELDQIIPPIELPPDTDLRQTRADPEQASDRVLGSADVPRGARPASARFRRPPGRALPTDDLPRALSRTISEISEPSPRIPISSASMRSVSASSVTTASSSRRLTTSTRSGSAPTFRAS